jgi:hypothetical protein
MRHWMDIINNVIEPVIEKNNLLKLLESNLDEGVVINDPAQFAAYAIAVAEAYDAAPKFTQNDKKFWDALNQSNNNVLLKRLAGDGIKIEYTADDPYEDGSNDPKMMVRRMLWDMTVNKRLAIYSGHSDDHPVFSSKDNVIFRTVHDYFTHGKLRKIFTKQTANLGKNPSNEELARLLPTINLDKSGNIGHQFTLRGEMNAYSTHAKLAPKQALPALFTEVVGQVCYHAVCGDFPIQNSTVLWDFDFNKVGLVKPNSTADARIKNIVEQIKSGQTNIKTKIKAKRDVDTKYLMKALSHISESQEIDEAGAGLSRVLKHMKNGQPFIQLTGARAGLSQKEITKRNNEIITILRNFGLGPINTVGGFDEFNPETGKTTRVREDSLFVPLNPKSHFDGDKLLELGELLSRKFEQDAMIYGDGEDVFSVDFLNNDIFQIGDYGAIDTQDMPYGWSSVKADKKSDGQKWAWSHSA